MRACVLTQESEEAPASSASLLATPMHTLVGVTVVTGPVKVSTRLVSWAQTMNTLYMTVMILTLNTHKTHNIHM